MGSESSFGLRGGFPVFFGDWNKARTAPDVSRFESGFTGSGDFDIQLSDRFTLGLEIGYQPMSGSDWEKYSATQGDTVKVVASYAYTGLLLRPCIWAGGRDFVRLEAGPILFIPSGSETQFGVSYPYDFFNTVRIGGKGGVEYGRVLVEGLALTFSGSLIVVPSGVSYTDGTVRTVVSLPLTLGARVYF